ncbi:hypothetical protein EPI10_020562 [Gossypium australe]|uniref:Uncharacterized protein n=1 Tax=Gossypium australe TaxID=47621 RepID=A0A5B6WGW8_9ROSI|nr:hypothetical protein EPI10_020562 [Gossypium australe]
MASRWILMAQKELMIKMKTSNGDLPASMVLPMHEKGKIRETYYEDWGRMQNNRGWYVVISTK